MSVHLLEIRLNYNKISIQFFLFVQRTRSTYYSQKCPKVSSIQVCLGLPAADTDLKDVFVRNNEFRGIVDIIYF